MWSFRDHGVGYKDDSNDSRGLRCFFCVSAVYSYSARRHALPSHHEVCDCVEGEQDVGHLCYTLHPLTLQPVLANGKHIVQQYQSLVD